MRRGTTSVLKLVTETDWSGYDIWVTIEQKNYEATFKDEKVQLSESCTDIYLSLTQEETLAFDKGSAKVQVKGKKDDNVIATEIASIKIEDILNEEVM